MSSLQILSDQELLQAYHSAVLYNLDKGFISILEEEVIRRGLSL